MAVIRHIDEQLLESAFGMGNGYVLNFSDKTFAEYFASIGINIDDDKYKVNGTSKAARLRAFWNIENAKVVSQSIHDMADMIINADLQMLTRGHLLPEARNIMNARREQMDRVKEIANKLDRSDDANIPLQQRHDTLENNLVISIRSEIFEHIKPYLMHGDYFHAVEEAYKLVRHKLQSLTGCEKASDVFNLNSESIKYWRCMFGKEADKGTPEYDFYRGVGYLHLGIQFLRNEKAHMPAAELDVNSAYHYIALASLAYDLISTTDTIK